MSCKLGCQTSSPQDDIFENVEKSVNKAANVGGDFFSLDEHIIVENMTIEGSAEIINSETIPAPAPAPAPEPHPYPKINVPSITGTLIALPRDAEVYRTQ